MARQKRSKIQNLQRKTYDAYNATRERLDDAKDTSEDLIKKNPLASVAVAAAVGALIALGVNALIRKEKKPFYRRFRDYL
mgnify:CR=1 FL=1